MNSCFAIIPKSSLSGQALPTDEVIARRRGNNLLLKLNRIDSVAIIILWVKFLS